MSALVVKAIRHLGGFTGVPLNTTLAPSATWPAHLALTAEGILGLYGADFTGRKLGFTVGPRAGSPGGPWRWRCGRSRS